MPYYVFTCNGGHATEARQGYDTSRIPCPACGEDAIRAPFGLAYLIGETVPKGQAKAGVAGIKDKHGRYRLSLFQEAHAELADHGVPTQRVYRRALTQAKRSSTVPIRAE